MTGKLSPEMLRKYVFGYRGSADGRIISGPGIGEDAAVIKAGEGRYMLVSSDPIVGAEADDVGRFLVEVNVNDIAVKGGKPEFVMLTLLVPESMGPEYVGRVMKDIDEACRKYDMAIIGGHTEFSGEVKRPIVSATVIGETDLLYDMGNAAIGDKVLIAGGIAMEGTYLIFNRKKEQLAHLFSPEEVKEVESYPGRLSVYEPARLLREHAVFMHDPTEGGICGGLTELAGLMEGKGIELYDDIDIPRPVKKLCSHLRIDPLKLISSGALMAVIPAGKCDTAAAILEEKGMEYQFIGEIAGENSFEPSFREELWDHI